MRNTHGATSQQGVHVYSGSSGSTSVASDTWQGAQREPQAQQSHEKGLEGASRHFLSENDRHPEEGTLK